jgi:hypothetical protein
LGLSSDPDFHAVSRDSVTVPGHTSPVFSLAHHRLRRRARPVLGFDDYNGAKIHSSCDGLLLLSLSDGRSTIYNPATRECAPLSCLTAAAGRTKIAALYLHRPSSEYRVLYRSHLEDDYYILMVQQRRSPRCIGIPADTPGIEEAVLSWSETTTTNLAPPVAFRDCLHWEPSSDDGIIVFRHDS